MKSWTAFSISAVAIASLCAANPAKADPPQATAQPATQPAAPAPAQTEASVAAAPVPASASPKSAAPVTLDTSRIRAFTFGTEVGTGVFGAELAGTLGAQTQQLTITPNRKYVLQWNGAAQLVGGVIANAHPYNPIYGVRAQAGGEAGVRLMPDLKLSPYIGAGLATDGHAVALSGRSSLATVNNVGAVGGVGGTASGRIYVGGSLLGSSHLAMLAFVQEQVLSRQTDAPAKAFTDFGFHAKYDIKDSLSLSGDIWIGQTGENKDAALGTTTRSNRWGGSLYAVKTIGEHWLIGGTAALAREGATTSNSGSALVFTTAGPINATFGLEVGYKP